MQMTATRRTRAKPPECESPKPSQLLWKGKTMPVTPYLFFNGRCEEAVEFYKKALGAEVGMMMRFKEAPDKPPPGVVPPGSEDKIMHACLRINGAEVMASDGCRARQVELRRLLALAQCPTKPRPTACSRRSPTAGRCGCRSARRSSPSASARSPTASAWAGWSSWRLERRESDLLRAPDRPGCETCGMRPSERVCKLAGGIASRAQHHAGRSPTGSFDGHATRLQQQADRQHPIGAATRRRHAQPQLAYGDLRQWLDEARRLGEVKDVSGLSWQQDIGMVAGVAMHDDSAPCFVFDHVPDTIEGSRVLVNFFGGKRKNMTLGFPAELTKLELSEGFRTSFMGPMTRIPPKYVNDGPIFENVMTRRRRRRHQISRAEMARGRRRPLHRHRQLQRHPRPGRGLDQLRHLPRDDPRRQDRAASTSRPASMAARCATSTRRAASAMPVAVVCGGDPDDLPRWPAARCPTA